MTITMSDGPDWSAIWAGVQAVGTLVALAIAIAVPVLQARAERNKDRQAAAGVAALAIDHIAHTSKIVTRDAAASVNPEAAGRDINFDVAVAALDAFPAHLLGDVARIQAFVELQAVTKLASETHTFIWDARMRTGKEPEANLKQLRQLAERAADLGKVLGVQPRH